VTDSGHSEHQANNLFESTLENSGAVWRITLTVHKKVIKVMNCAMRYSFCHAFDNRFHHFVNGETSI